MSTRKRPPEDFDREIQAHLELEADRLQDEGLAPDAARDAARRAFGNVTTARERFHEAGRLIWLDHLAHDVRCAARNMRRAPVAAIVAVASLAAGIGATTVTLTVRNVVFRNPPPLYRQPEQLSHVQVGRTDRPIMPLGHPVSASLYLTWRETLGDSIAASMDRRGPRDIRTGDRTDTAPVRGVTPGLFDLLGVTAELGHATLERTAGGSPRAVLGYQLWQRLFDGRPDALGQILWIDNEAHTVVGVMPPRFWFGEMNSPVWIAMDPRTLAQDEALQIVVRRPPGTTLALLEAQLRTGVDDYARRVPAAERNLRLRVSGVEGTPVGRQVALILPYLLATSVLLTLLIACANVAILMIAQWTAREHEIAIRASIGASRGRIVRSLLTESVLVAVVGGLLGVAFTFALRGWIVRSGGDVGFFDLSIDNAVLAQTALITLLTGIVAGIAPALYETRRLHVNPLRTLAGSDRVRQRWRSALVVFEITVTVALLVETAAMIDGYLRSTRANMGYDTTRLLSARVENPAGVPADDVVRILDQMPGVAAAAAGTIVPYGASGERVRVSLDATGSNAVVTERGAISAEFFATLGVPLRAGRPFSTHDEGALAIVSETLARRLFQGRDPLGARIWIGDTAYDLVGVVADYATNPLRTEQREPRVYVPLPARSAALRRLSFLIRAEADPAPLTQSIRREVRDNSPGSIVTSAYTAEQIMDVAGKEILVGTAPLVPLIVIGMLLTTAGIYGVLAFAITRRSRELALRLAIGASGGDLVRLVSAQSLRLVAAGTVAGIAVTFALSRIVRANGGAGSIWDPGVQAFVVPVGVVLVIGVLATWIPSRRALKINPADLLKST